MSCWQLISYIQTPVGGVDAQSDSNEQVDYKTVNDWYYCSDYPYKLRDAPVTEAEAVDQVRRFSGDTHANISFDRRYTYPDELDRIVMYGDNGTYVVIARTGEVWRALFTYPANNDRDLISESDAIKIASAYVEKHYYAFHMMNGMRFSKAELLHAGIGDREYAITFSQKLDGIETLNSVTVNVDAENGHVMSYTGMHVLIPEPVANSLSKTDAVRIAVKRLGNISYENTESNQESDWAFRLNSIYWSNDWMDVSVNGIMAKRTKTSDSNLMQHEAWCVEFDAIWPGDGHHYWVTVDEHTGEILHFEHCM